MQRRHNQSRRRQVGRQWRPPSLHYLTAEEKDRMMSVIAARAQQSQAQAQMVPESEEELEPDYSRPSLHSP